MTMDDCHMNLIGLVLFVSARCCVKADKLTIGGHPDAALRAGPACGTGVLGLDGYDLRVYADVATMALCERDRKHMPALMLAPMVAA